MEMRNLFATVRSIFQFNTCELIANAGGKRTPPAAIMNFVVWLGTGRFGIG